MNECNRLIAQPRLAKVTVSRLACKGVTSAGSGGCNLHIIRWHSIPTFKQEILLDCD